MNMCFKAPTGTLPLSNSRLSTGRVNAPKPSTSLARLSSRSHFRPVKVPTLQKGVGIQRCSAVQKGIFALNQYPDPEFIKATVEAFPEKGIANYEEARVLFAEGWKWLDVRSEPEIDSMGKVAGSINIPIINAKTKWNSETNSRDYVQNPNAKFVEMVQQKFPDKQSKILVGCSDGRARAVQALMALDAAGYTNIAGVQGGFNLWSTVFTNKLERRKADAYTEVYTHEGDACGIHGTGAGGDAWRVDAIQKPAIRDTIEWINWHDAMKTVAA